MISCVLIRSSNLSSVGEQRAHVCLLACFGGFKNSPAPLPKAFEGWHRAEGPHRDGEMALFAVRQNSSRNDLFIFLRKGPRAARSRGPYPHSGRGVGPYCERVANRIRQLQRVVYWSHSSMPSRPDCCVYSIVVAVHTKKWCNLVVHWIGVVSQSTKGRKSCHAPTLYST